MNIVSIQIVVLFFIVLWAFMSLSMTHIIEDIDLFNSMPYGLKLTAIIMSPITLTIFEAVLAITIVISIFTDLYHSISELKK